MKLETCKIAVIGCAILMAGCSANYNVSKQDEDLPTIISEPGIYYMLPKTEVIAGFDITLVKKTTGAWAEKFEGYVDECIKDASLGHEIPIDKEPSESFSYKDAKPFVLTRSIADPTHRYKLDVDFDSFSEFTHTVELSESGVVTTSNSKVQNGAVNLALNTLTAVKDIALSVTGISSDSAAKTSSISLALSTKKKTLSESCRMIFEIQNTLMQLQDVEKERRQHIRDKSNNVSLEVLKEAMLTFDTEATEIKKSNKYLEKISVKTEKKFLRYITRVTPEDFKSAACTNLSGDLLIVAETTEAGIPEPQIKASNEIIEKFMQDFKIDVSVEPVQKYSKAEHDESELKGYRYRIPTEGKIKLKIDQLNESPKKEGEKNSYKPIAELELDKVIAQYGPIASLPNKINGLEGSLDLIYYGDTGALQKIVVGAKALPSSTISDFANIGADAVLKKRAADEAAKEAAEDKELNTLLKENQLLEAKQKNNELKKALGED